MGNDPLPSRQRSSTYAIAEAEGREPAAPPATPHAIAVLIINHGRATDTIECLESVLHHFTGDYHVHLLDNGSGGNDSTLLEAFASEAGDRITYHHSDVNLGFAGGNNLLLEHVLASSTTEYVLLLNNDTVVCSDILSVMVATVDRTSRQEMIAARMMDFTDRCVIDSLGIALYKSGIASNRKSEDDPLLGPTGGCALYTADALRTIQRKTGELFDSAFFCYAEDTDLALRARLLGYRAALACEAIVYHKGSMSAGGRNSDFVTYYGLRNSLLVLAKDLPAKLIARNIGWIAIMQVAIMVRYLTKRKAALIFRIHRDFLRLYGLMRAKRVVIQRHSRGHHAPLERFISRRFYEPQATKSAWKELFAPRR